MRWNENEVIAWLDDAGLLAGRTVARVASMSQRATSVLVTLQDGSSLFVKRPSKQRREGALLALLHGRDDLAPIRPLLPVLVAHDDALNVAVTAGLGDRISLRELCNWRPPGNGPLVRAVGAELARLHVATAASSLASARGGCPDVPNPVPTYGDVTPADLARAPGRNFGQLLAVVQEFNDALVALRATWRPSCFIHGDFKDDNVMVGGATEAPALTFIDWEMSGWGDPAWDVGSMVGQFLYHWATSIRRGGAGFASWVRSAAVPFALVRSSVAAFVESYAAAAGRDAADAAWLERVLQLAGLFLLHRATATVELLGTLPVPATSCLQVARTLIDDPARARPIVVGEAS